MHSPCENHRILHSTGRYVDFVAVAAAAAVVRTGEILHIQDKPSRRGS